MTYEYFLVAGGVGGKAGFWRSLVDQKYIIILKLDAYIQFAKIYIFFASRDIQQLSIGSRLVAIWLVW